jgi:hypothetical protein
VLLGSTVGEKPDVFNFTPFVFLNVLVPCIRS